MTRRTPGTALLLIIILLAFLIVVGFALADLCVVNLQMSRQYLLSTRAALLAQAAVQNFLVVFDQACRRARSGGLDLQKGGSDLGLRELYADGNGLPHRAIEGMRGTVGMTFDPVSIYHSTDNALNEYPTSGWYDRGTPQTSVPAFSVDLVVNVDLDDGFVRHYEAIVGRRWPFAVFAEKGLVVVCGTPVGTGPDDMSVASPSSIEGPIAMLEKNPPLGTVSLTPPAAAVVLGQNGSSAYWVPSFAGPRLSPADPIRALRASIDAFARTEESAYGAYSDAAVTVGPVLRVNTHEKNASFLEAPPPASTSQTSASPLLTEATVEIPAAASEPKPAGVAASSTATSMLDEAGNILAGDVTLRGVLRERQVDMGATSGAQVCYGVRAVDARPDNTFSGRIYYDQFPDGVDESNNPVEDARFPTDDRLFFPIPPPPLPDSVKDQLWRDSVASVAGGLSDVADQKQVDPSKFGFLFSTLTLDPDLPHAPPLQFGSRNNHFCFHGNLGNRFIVQVKSQKSQSGGGSSTEGAPSQAATKNSTFKLFESPGGIKLRNSILFVNGNLDLSARYAPHDQVGIEGSNATLIVNGTLALSGGHLDSRDQGMVIFANDVILRASGDYRGLIIAKNRLAILPATEDGSAQSTLSIRGGVLCGGKDTNLVLRSVHLVYDPIYMKAVHPYGAAVCTMWREMP